MAVQMHVAHSEVFMGVGVLAGGTSYNWFAMHSFQTRNMSGRMLQEEQNALRAQFILDMKYLTLHSLNPYTTGPYMCAGNNLFTATGACMEYPNQIDVSDLQQMTRDRAYAGSIDAYDVIINLFLQTDAGNRAAPVTEGEVQGL